MNELETLKKQIAVLETKALVYYNELGDEHAYNALKTQINELNSMVLTLMTIEGEMQRFEAFIA